MEVLSAATGVTAAHSFGEDGGRRSRRQLHVSWPRFCVLVHHGSKHKSLPRGNKGGVESRECPQKEGQCSGGPRLITQQIPE